MTRTTGVKWKTDKCGSCGQRHEGYSGKLNAEGLEYVICGQTEKVCPVPGNHWVKFWASDPAKRRIVCAAVLMTNPSGDSIKLVAPRHWDETMHAQWSMMQHVVAYDRFKESDQGFIDQFGTFYDRKEALIIARRHNQIRPEGKSGNPDSDELFSEDLY